MSSFTDVVVSVDFLKIALPAAGAIAAWWLNERSKVRSAQLQRKEERYQELLRCLKGFYIGSLDSELKRQFIDQVKLCWLYSPDDVVRKANTFFAAIHTERKEPATNEEKERALAEFILAIRKDMLSRRLVSKTSLSSQDWKSFHAS